MNHKIPPFVPIYSNLIDDKRIKRLNKDMPNCSGLGIMIGLYFNLLKDSQLRCSYDDIDIIADELRTSVPLIITVIESYSLFEIIQDDGKKFFSPILNQALQPYFEKCETNKINAQIGVQKKKLKKEKQLEELKQLSLFNSSQRPLSDGEPNKNTKEENIKEKNLSKKDGQESFQNFKKKLTGKEVRFTLPYPFASFAQNTVIRLRKTGYLHNESIEKDLTPEQAHSVWEYMFKKREQIIERINSNQLPS